MSNILTFISQHPFSSSFAVVTPMMIPAQYHVVLAQLLLQFGIFGIEFLYKKLKLINRRKDVESSFDNYLDGVENPTTKR